MSAPTNGTVPRAPSPPSVGGIRGAILSALIAALAKWGLPPELNDALIMALSALVGFGLTFAGKAIRDKWPWIPSVLVPF